MLLCIDAGKAIRVFRLVQSESGPAKRERVGVISKKDFAIGAAFADLEAGDEAPVEGEAVAAGPHVDASDDTTLRRHVRTAVFEGLRVMRKAGPASAAGNTPSPFL